MKTKIFLILFAIFSIAFFIEVNTHKNIMFRPQGTELLGEPSRVEPEYKIKFTPPKKPTDFSPIEFSVGQYLSEIINQERWQLLDHYGYKYSLDKDEKTFVFLDIYFKNTTLKPQKAAYRLRIRWENVHDFYNYLAGDTNVSIPTRAEVQVKIRERVEDDLIFSRESRFEIRDFVYPFNEIGAKKFLSNSNTLFNIATAGSFSQKNLRTTDDFFKFNEWNSLNEIQIVPHQVLLTFRKRRHFLADTPWGIGQNSQHTFIITVDSLFRFVDVNLFVEQFLNSVFTKETIQEFVNKNVVFSHGELELEFERNASEGVKKIGDRDIEKTYFRDLKILKEAIFQKLNADNLFPQISIDSKYEYD